MTTTATMTAAPSALGQLSELVAVKLGLSFPPERWRDLERALKPAAIEMGFGDVESYARWLVQSPLGAPELEVLAARLTVGETYFFREPKAYDALRDTVVPELLDARRGRPAQLRVWSAGCCTGEEAYSLAIFFDRFCPELRDWQIRILGTDINPHFLRKARAGIYRSWSFRGAPAWLQAGYFTALGDDRFEVRPDIRDKVEFEALNLAEDSFPSLHNHTNGLDLVFCRNVLMYFSPEQARRTLAGFHRCLLAAGHLVVGVCETSIVSVPGYRARAFPGVTIYQKADGAPKQRMAAAQPPIVPPLAVELSAPAVAVNGVALTELAAAGRARSLAEEAYRNGDYAATVDHLEAWLARAPFDIDSATLLARAQANQGNLGEARRWIERALVADRLRAPLYYLRANVLQEQGEAGLAVEALEKALYVDPNFVLAHIALADLSARAGRRAKADRHLGEALRCLRRHNPEEVIADAEGLTARRLIAMVEAMQAEEPAP